MTPLGGWAGATVLRFEAAPLDHKNRTLERRGCGTRKDRTTLLASAQQYRAFASAALRFAKRR
jgi:hypothetical protein